MRRSHALAVGLCACLALAPTVGAQQTVPFTGPIVPAAESLTPGVVLGLQQPPPPPPPPPPLLAGPPSITAEVIPGPPRPTDSKEALFSLDVLLGQQTGIRSQFALYRGERESVVVEAFYGALIHTLGTSEALGVGGRYLLRRGSADGINSMVFSPGVDLLFQLNRDGLVLLNPSVELSWLHGFGDRCGWEIGVNAGLGLGVGGETSRDRSAAGRVTPLISVFTGFRF